MFLISAKGLFSLLIRFAWSSIISYTKCAPWLSIKVILFALLLINFLCLYKGFKFIVFCELYKYSLLKFVKSAGCSFIKKTSLIFPCVLLFIVFPCSSLLINFLLWVGFPPLKTINSFFSSLFKKYIDPAWFCKNFFAIFSSLMISSFKKFNFVIFLFGLPKLIIISSFPLVTFVLEETGRDFLFWGFIIYGVWYSLLNSPFIFVQTYALDPVVGSETKITKLLFSGLINFP